MKTVLVSGASGIVGYGILKSLRKSSRALRLLGSSMHQGSVAEGFCDQFVLAPHSDHFDYLSWLIETVRQNRVDLVIPGIEIDLYHWVKHRTVLEDAGAKVVMNQPDLVELCKDKWLFYQALRSSGSPCAIPSRIDGDFDSLRTEFGLPILLKPRRGFGARGIRRISDAAEFAAAAPQLGGILMAQPVVGSDAEEYTTSAFGDGRGALCAAMTMRRELSKDGFTDRAEVCDSAPFLEAINSLAKLWRPLGPTNFQFRMDRGEPKLLEINPRISSSTSIRAAFGYNESEMSVNFYLDGKLPIQPEVKAGRAVRYVEDFIFYENRIHS